MSESKPGEMDWDVFQPSCCKLSSYSTVVKYFQHQLKDCTISRDVSPCFRTNV